MPHEFLPCGCAEGEACSACVPEGDDAHVIAREALREARQYFEATR